MTPGDGRTTTPSRFWYLLSLLFLFAFILEFCFWYNIDLGAWPAPSVFASSPGYSTPTMPSGHACLRLRYFAWIWWRSCFKSWYFSVSYLYASWLNFWVFDGCKLAGTSWLWAPRRVFASISSWATLLYFSKSLSCFGVKPLCFKVWSLWANWVVLGATYLVGLAFMKNSMTLDSLAISAGFLPRLRNAVLGLKLFGWYM